MQDDNHNGSNPTPDPGAADQAPVAGEKAYWLDTPANVHKIYYGLWVVCGLLVLADLFYEKHPHFAIEGWFGFYGFYGLVSCVSLVLAAKVLRRLVIRPEDYYDE